MKQKTFIYCSLLFALLSFSISRAEWKPIGYNQKPLKPSVKIISHSQNEYTIEVNLFGFDSSEVRVENNIYQKILLPDYFTAGEEGKPELPNIVESLCLPEQAKVDISIIDSSIITFNNYLIYPRQRVSPENIKKEFRIDKEFYKRNIFYPEKLALVDNKGGVWRDLNVRTLRIYPVKYNPVTKEMKVYNRLILKIKCTDEGGGIINKNISPEWDEIYKDNVLNYSLLNPNNLTINAEPFDSYKYLIITDDNFVPNIKPFADYKTRQGLLSKVYPISQITTTKDDKAIRAFIKDEFNNHHIEYVLLVGDAYSIPMASYHFNKEASWSLYKGDYAYTCTKLLDDDPNLVYQNFYSSIGIGRILAHSVWDVDDFVSKTLGYETNPPLDNNWAGNALFVSWPNDGSSQFKEKKTQIQTNSSGFYQNIYTAYGDDPGISNASIKTPIESYGVGTINYRGHGDVNSWFQWVYPNTNGSQSFTDYDALNLINGKKLPVVFSIACSTSKIDDFNRSLAEAFTNASYGAVAFLGATSSTGDETNNTFDAELFNKIRSNNYTRKRISVISNDAKKAVLDNYCGPKEQLYSVDNLGGDNLGDVAKYDALFYLWLGDPALDMYTGPISQIPGIEVKDDGSSVTVSAGIPCDICISGGSNGTEIYNFVPEDPLISVPTNTVYTNIRPLYITITAHNYVPYNAITGGTLSADEIWMYNMNILGDVTVPSGKSLTVKPGTCLTFKNNFSLIVSGTLNANGSTFDFISGNSTYKNGIKLLPGSTASIYNSTIKNAYTGIDLNQAYLSLSGCNITGCSNHGINMYDENSVSNRSVISNCNIYGNTGSGIVLYYSSPIIKGNNIYSNYYGMGLSDYSAPQLGYMGAYGYNHIYSNRSHGFSAQRNSNPFLGENICIENGGHNRIENNTSKNVSVYGNSIVTAENNWWEYLSDGVTINTTKFYVSSGAFDYYPPADPEDPESNFSLASNPASGQSSPEEMLYDRQFTSSSMGIQSKEGISENQMTYATKDTLQGNAEFKTPSGFDEKWSLLKKLTYARYMHFLNKDLEAEEICKKVIESFPDSSLSYYALDILWQSARKSRIEDFKIYLNLIKSNLDRKPVSLMAEVLQARFDKENRIKLLDELSSKIKNMPMKDLSSSARQDILESLLFSKLLHYLNDENNASKAKDMVSEIDALVGMGSHSSVEAHSLLGEIIPENDKLTKDLKSSEESAAIEKPTEYSLSDNYPNPFNPSTRIDYTLPMISKVELRVYDILGHEVATLVNTVQEAGRYSAQFNASDISSGLYIYKIISQSLENGKVFEKTGKMMFMK